MLKNKKWWLGLALVALPVVSYLAVVGFNCPEALFVVAAVVGATALICGGIKLMSENW